MLRLFTWALVATLAVVGVRMAVEAQVAGAGSASRAAAGGNGDPTSTVGAGSVAHVPRPVAGVQPPLMAVRDAIGAARGYLALTGFSPSSLVAQLRADGFTRSVAWGVVAGLEVDWSAEAVEVAWSVVRNAGVGSEELSTRLRAEGFTPEQVRVAVATVRGPT